MDDFWCGQSIINILNSSLYGKLTTILLNNTINNNSYLQKIPSIIILGTESSGKSSLLENIIKAPIFYRNSNICTKQPIHIILKTAFNESDISYSIKYDNNRIIINKFDIAAQIEIIMSKIASDEISDKIIEINICDINLPNIMFVDLPGVRTYPKNIAIQTTKLIEKYLLLPHTFVLCVVPATITRLTSYKPIAIIKKCNMEINTILVLTMCDRVQNLNIYDLIVKRITLQTDEFIESQFAGCVAIINRLHDNNITLQNNDSFEEEWFKNNIIDNIPVHLLTTFKNMICNKITIINLLHNLSKLCNKFIKNEWIPNIVNKLTNDINNINIKIHNIGIDPKNNIDKKILLNIYAYNLGINSINIGDCDQILNFCTFESNDNHKIEYIKELFLDFNKGMIDIDELTSEIIKNENDVLEIDNIDNTFDDKLINNIVNKLTDIEYIIKNKNINSNDYINININRFDKLNHTISKLIIAEKNKLITNIFNKIIPACVYEYILSIDDNVFENQLYNKFSKLYKQCWINAGYKIFNKINDLDEFIHLEESFLLQNLRYKLFTKLSSINNDIEYINTILNH